MANQGIKIDLINSKSSILRLIDDQINNCKVQYIREWERNHAASPLVKEEKIKKLEAVKEEVIAYFEKSDASELPKGFNLLIDY